MRKIRILLGLFALITLPLTLYLQYWIISQLNADRLIWFLFFLQIPFIIFITIVGRMLEIKD